MRHWMIPLASLALVNNVYAVINPQLIFTFAQDYPWTGLRDPTLGSCRLSVITDVIEDASTLAKAGIDNLDVLIAAPGNKASRTSIQRVAKTARLIWGVKPKFGYFSGKIASWSPDDLDLLTTARAKLQLVYDYLNGGTNNEAFLACADANRWVTKLGEYIDPSYLKPADNPNQLLSDLLNMPGTPGYVVRPSFGTMLQTPPDDGYYYDNGSPQDPTGHRCGSYKLGDTTKPIDTQGYTTRIKATPDYVSIPMSPYRMITICDGTFVNLRYRIAQWKANAVSANDRIVGETSTSTSIRGTDLSKVESVGKVLLHEMLHFVDEKIGDQAVSAGEVLDHQFTADAAYGIWRVHFLSKQNRALTVKNADSYALWAMAVYLDGWDWHVGKARVKDPNE